MTTETSGGTFKIGEPISSDNPLPVTTDTSRVFKPGEPISTENPLPVFLVSAPEAPTLTALGGVFALQEDAAAGAIAGFVVGKTIGSVLTLGDDAGGRIALQGTTIVRGATALDFETAQDLGGGNRGWTFSVTESLNGATNSPLTTPLTLLVTAVEVQPVLPGDIVDLTATAQSDTEVLLTWTPASDATSHQYRVDGGSWTACDDNTGAQLVTGLTPQTLYAFEVRGVNADGNGPASNTDTATTEATPDTTAPTITSANPTGSYEEGVPIGGTLTADEPVTWTVTGADAAAVTLDPDTGVWTLEETVFATKASYSFTFTATDGASNSADHVVAITITEAAAPGETSPLAAPTLSLAGSGDSYPPQLNVLVDETYQQGDKIALYSAASLNGTYTLLATATLDATAIAAGTVAISGLSGITSPTQTWFKAYGRRTGYVDSEASNIIKHGDVTGPTITSAAVQSQGEYEPMAYVITADEDIEHIEIIGGTDAALVKISGTTVTRVDGADLNYNSQPKYEFNFRTYDYGGNFTDTNATLNVGDEQPAAFTFNDALNVEPSAALASNTPTLSGVSVGKDIPYTATPAAGFVFQINGTNAANTGMMHAGDTFGFVGVASANFSTVSNNVLDIDGVTDTYTVSTKANPAAVSVEWRGAQILDFAFGSTPKTTNPITVQDGDKVLITVDINFNTGTAVTVTAKDGNGVNVPLTLVSGWESIFDKRKMFLYYADNVAAGTLSVTAAPNASTALAAVMMVAVRTAAAGGPIAVVYEKRAVTNENPHDVDESLTAPTAGAVVTFADFSSPVTTHTYSAGTKLGEIANANNISMSTAYRTTPGDIKIQGQPSGGPGYCPVNIVATSWGPA